VIVKPDVDRLLTVPDDPPAAGPDRALDPPPPELLPAAGVVLPAGGVVLAAAVEPLLEVVLTIP
jgi:hypothetical protein